MPPASPPVGLLVVQARAILTREIGDVGIRRRIGPDEIEPIAHFKLASRTISNPWHQFPWDHWEVRNPAYRSEG